MIFSLPTNFDLKCLLKCLKESSCDSLILIYLFTMMYQAKWLDDPNYLFEHVNDIILSVLIIVFVDEIE